VDLGQELLRAVLHPVRSGVDDDPSFGGQSVAPVQVVLPVELGEWPEAPLKAPDENRPPLDLDDHPFAEEAEIDTGDEVATGVGDDVLLQDLEAGANEQPAN